MKLLYGLCAVLALPALVVASAICMASAVVVCLAVGVIDRYRRRKEPPEGVSSVGPCNTQPGGCLAAAPAPLRQPELTRRYDPTRPRTARFVHVTAPADREDRWINGSPFPNHAPQRALHPGEAGLSGGLSEALGNSAWTAGKQFPGGDEPAYQQFRDENPPAVDQQRAMERDLHNGLGQRALMPGPVDQAGIAGAPSREEIMRKRSEAYRTAGVPEPIIPDQVPPCPKPGEAIKVTKAELDASVDQVQPPAGKFKPWYPR